MNSVYVPEIATELERLDVQTNVLSIDALFG